VWTDSWECESIASEGDSDMKLLWLGVQVREFECAEAAWNGASRRSRTIEEELTKGKITKKVKIGVVCGEIAKDSIFGLRPIL
jgi:hypothetical protein